METKAPLPVRVLHLLHLARCGTVSLMADALGTRTDAVSYALRELEDGGWVRRLGYSKADPNLGFHGSWWIPSRRDPRGRIWNTRLRAVVKPLSEADVEGKRVFEFEDNLYMRRHDIYAARYGLEAAAFASEKRLGLTWMTETYLRQCLGWYANLVNVSPALQSRGHVVSVPDFRLAAADGRAINVEIELSRKSIEAYQRVVDQAEHYSVLMFATPTQSQADALLDIFRRIGKGRASRIVVGTLDDLCAGLEAVARDWGLPG